MAVTSITIGKDGKFTLQGTLDTPAPSKSGKTTVILSTRGAATFQIPGAEPVKVNLNVYR